MGKSGLWIKNQSNSGNDCQSEKYGGGSKADKKSIIRFREDGKINEDIRYIWQK